MGVGYEGANTLFRCRRGPREAYNTMVDEMNRRARKEKPLTACYGAVFNVYLGRTLGSRVPLVMYAPSPSMT